MGLVLNGAELMIYADLVDVNKIKDLQQP